METDANTGYALPYQAPRPASLVEASLSMEPLMNTVVTPPTPAGRSRQYATIVKMAVIAILVLLLMIPMVLISSVLSERLQRRDSAIREITGTWGDAQTIAGPMLVVPYRYSVKTSKEQAVKGRTERVEAVETAVAHAYFLPASLKVSGNLKPSRLHRGIYEAVVYSGTLQLQGTFAPPSFDEWNVKPEDVMWSDAVVALVVSDLRGAREALVMKWGDASFLLAPGWTLGGFASGVSARLKGLTLPAANVPFSCALTLNGSRGISIAPVGVHNDVFLSSAWPDPSFRGAFLPTERTISASGFEARWQVSYYGRSYPQQWTDQTDPAPLTRSSIEASLFGVDLVSVVDSYRFVERSIKYGVLFIALVFTTFFLFEVLARIRIHPFQYALVGAALCLFYLALLSLSEFISFGASYLAGAATASLMVTLYSFKVLRSGARSLVVTAGLAVIYTFLYVILRLQDYSLLLGTAGLFLVLAVMMYVTRNIDWYARDREG